MQTSKQKEIRSVFMKRLVGHLIQNILTPEQLKQIQEEEGKKRAAELMVKQARTVPIIKSPLRKFQPFQLTKPLKQKVPPIQSLPAHPTQLNNQKIELGNKIVPLLKDPNVFTIESPGPNKHVLVNRGGSIQTTPVTLTKEEISKIMQEISEKTRIPLVPGLFKAAFKNLLITAVVSDFVGTRFLIQKRTPF